MRPRDIECAFLRGCCRSHADRACPSALECDPEPALRPAPPSGTYRTVDRILPPGRPVPLERAGPRNVRRTVSLPRPWPLSVAQRRPRRPVAAQPIQSRISGASKMASCEAPGRVRAHVGRISARLPAAWEATADEPGPRTSSPVFSHVMERRRFIRLIGGSLLAAPLAAETFSGSCQAICF
jgi:hypothetical protein